MWSIDLSYLESAGRAWYQLPGTVGPDPVRQRQVVVLRQPIQVEQNLGGRGGEQRLLNFLHTNTQGTGHPVRWNISRSVLSQPLSKGCRLFVHRGVFCSSLSSYYIRSKCWVDLDASSLKARLFALGDLAAAVAAIPTSPASQRGRHWQCGAADYTAMLTTLDIRSKTRGKASPAEIVATTDNLWQHPSSVRHNGLVNQGATESHR
jgi:hypothetical protein